MVMGTNAPVTMVTGPKHIGWHLLPDVYQNPVTMVVSTNAPVTMVMSTNAPVTMVVSTKTLLPW